MRRQRTFKRQRSRWFGLWLVLLVVWSALCAMDLMTVQDRADTLSRVGKTDWERAGSRIGVAIAYNQARDALWMRWLIGAAPLVLFLLLTRGHAVIEERWVDSQGRPVAPPSQRHPIPPLT